MNKDISRCLKFVRITPFSQNVIVVCLDAQVFSLKLVLFSQIVAVSWGTKWFRLDVLCIPVTVRITSVLKQTWHCLKHQGTVKICNMPCQLPIYEFKNYFRLKVPEGIETWYLFWSCNSDILVKFSCSFSVKSLFIRLLDVICEVCWSNQ